MKETFPQMVLTFLWKAFQTQVRRLILTTQNTQITNQIKELTLIIEIRTNLIVPPFIKEDGLQKNIKSFCKLSKVLAKTGTKSMSL